MQTRVIAARHARPADPDPERYPTDYDRPLTQEGEQQQLHVIQLLRVEGLIPDYIYTSPALRAVQTGELIAHELGGHLLVEDGLGTPFDHQRVFARLHPQETTCLVGHNPTLAHFVELLVGEPCFPGGLVKSGAVVIEFDGNPSWGQGRVTAYHHPK